MRHSTSQSPDGARNWDEIAAERRAVEESARALCMAIVMRAFRDLLNKRCLCRRTCSCSKEDRRLYKEAKDWIDGCAPDLDFEASEIKTGRGLTQDEALDALVSLDQFWTFDNVCAILGWDSNWVRAKLPHLTPADVRRLDSLW